LVKLAGIPFEKVVSNGNAKSEAELRAAVEAQVTVWYPWTLFKYFKHEEKIP